MSHLWAKFYDEGGRQTVIGDQPRIGDKSNKTTFFHSSLLSTSRSGYLSHFCPAGKIDILCQLCLYVGNIFANPACL